MESERIRIKDIAKMADVSVGTVDRVIHGRSGVSETSRKRVEEILKQLDYQPNMYASALASNKKYAFSCLLPQHEKGEYWTAVEAGIHEALVTYSDFNISVKLSYYDPFDYHSFSNVAQDILKQNPDGIMFAPTVPQYTQPFTEELNKRSIPYIYIDSNLEDASALSFFGQNSHQSGHFAAKMMMLLAGSEQELVIFRKINEGIVGSNQQERREIGFREYMQRHHPDRIIRELNLHAKHDSNDAQMLDNFFREHPNVKNGITFNSKVYIVGEYLQKQKKENFNLIGYDLLGRNVDCLKQGSVFFLIAQQPGLQGFDGIKALCDHLIFKKEIPRVNFMPIDLLTKENIQFYFNKQRCVQQ
ncbi:LacI family DNA-binding transcriptional regulator [uncultured Bacteroides sp.]|uniref:LacI family DNA-binding transcriptional regulator n=1 Tax=uncultured Bacteroides sp. TaxID=162156 RepID=UPI0025F6775C|nr:LacI family DNA-binding transcriptional regulator [uncultured Bacteroides sp.]